jgi:hypothetical protein
MTIERQDVLTIRPEWGDPKGNRYQSLPALRIAFIQLLEEPEFVYIVTDQALPESVAGAVGMVQQWRISQDAAED